MMKLKMKRSLASPYPGTSRVGATVEVPDAVGESWVERGYAERASPVEERAPTDPSGKRPAKRKKKVTTASQTKA